MRYNSAPARRDAILRRLSATGYASPAELGAALSVSERTVRRDLQTLAESGRVDLVYGGAVPKPGARPGLSFRARSQIWPERKRAIATKAISMIAPGDTIGIDAGTTTIEFAHLLPAGLDVTAVTASLPVMTSLRDRDDVALVGLGGMYDAMTQSFTGPDTVVAMSRLRLSCFFLAASSLGNDGAYCNGSLDAEVKRTFIGIADRVVLLADSSKFEESAPVHICPYDRIDTLVTDALPAPTRSWFADSGTGVHEESVQALD
ncbi:DeoR/GlpR family DNA-binding transcription regulator [Allokutzneria albata]|uniref:DNA-binding transcriptional regulator of sugar metabolism, DeoR/GlpR family n=1 Tax=Allokutzneria albata TaxID=211114 RepID=A0A1G9U5D1_ALLAB|nr:DeoR/GlpR family DNA-binding transcription regulator [Allokutzneria albata]SDM54775.1 DNA-binding transcriptional regulator of sugar metabolism, DeoR/GlpR family [Allokutzneria albata]